MKKIKVLVVDDSALMRKIISDMINSEEDMEAVDTARNGQDMLNKIISLNPDVVTLDVEMPVMDGFTALKEMRKVHKDIPVIMLSSLTQSSAAFTMDCLEAGAFDFVSKPSGSISLDINKVKEQMIEKIRLAFGKESPLPDQIQRNGPAVRRPTNKIEAVVIGASTGGPKALYTVVTALPERVGVPVFIVQHMPAGFTKAFAERLNANSKLKVLEASDGQLVERDVVYIAPGGYHMELQGSRRIHLNTEPSVWGVRPAVDKLFLSASKAYGAHLLSIVLTGMGKDGAQGSAEVKKNGGITIAEDKSTCTIYGMPKAAFDTGMIDLVVPIDEIAAHIIKIIGEGK